MSKEYGETILSPLYLKELTHTSEHAIIIIQTILDFFS